MLAKIIFLYFDIGKLLTFGGNTQIPAGQTVQVCTDPGDSSGVAKYGLILIFLAWDQSEKFVKLYLTGLNGLDKCPNDNINITYSRYHLMNDDNWYSWWIIPVNLSMFELVPSLKIRTRSMCLVSRKPVIRLTRRRVTIKYWMIYESIIIQYIC